MRRLTHIRIYALFLISSSLWLVQGQWGIGLLILLASGVSLAYRLSKGEEAIYGYFATGLRPFTWLLIALTSIPAMSDGTFYTFLALTLITIRAIDLGTDPKMKQDWTSRALVCEFLIQVIGAMALL